MVDRDHTQRRLAPPAHRWRKELGTAGAWRRAAHCGRVNRACQACERLIAAAEPFNEATAERYIEQYARKGSRVVIQGHVENDTWTGKDGVEHYDLRLIVGDIRLKNRRDHDEQKEHAEGQTPVANSVDDERLVRCLRVRGRSSVRSTPR